MDPRWARQMEERLEAQAAELRQLRQQQAPPTRGPPMDMGYSSRPATQPAIPSYYRSDDPHTYGPPIASIQRIAASASPLSHRAPAPRPQYVEEDRRRADQQALQQQQSQHAQALAAQAEEKRQLLSQLHAERTKCKAMEAESLSHAQALERLQQQVGTLNHDLAGATNAVNRLRKQLLSKEQELEDFRHTSTREATVWGNISALRTAWGHHTDMKDVAAPPTNPSPKKRSTKSTAIGASDSIIIGSEASSSSHRVPYHHSYQSSSASAGYKRDREEGLEGDIGCTSMTLGLEDAPVTRNLSLVRVLPPAHDTPVKGRRTAAPRKPSVTHADRVSGVRGVVNIPASPMPKAPAARGRGAIDPVHSVGGANASTSKVTAATSFSASYSRTNPGPIGRQPPTRSPSPNNPKKGPNIERRFVLSGFNESEMHDIQKAVSKLGDIASGSQPRAVILRSDRDGDLPLDCTHVLIPGIPQNFKALCGLVSERFIVNPVYVFNSLEAGFWLDEQETNHLRYTPSPLSHHRFAIVMSDRTPEERDLKDRVRTIIELGKGTVVSSQAASTDGVIVITSGRDILNFCMK